MDWSFLVVCITRKIGCQKRFFQFMVDLFKQFFQTMSLCWLKLYIFVSSADTKKINCSCFELECACNSLKLITRTTLQTGHHVFLLHLYDSFKIEVDRHKTEEFDPSVRIDLNDNSPAFEDFPQGTYFQITKMIFWKILMELLSYIYFCWVK